MRSRSVQQLVHLRSSPRRIYNPIQSTRLSAPVSGPTAVLNNANRFHSSPWSQNEEKRSNLPPQSPFKVFVQTLKEEIQKNRTLQEDMKTLQGDVDKLADSESMKRAKEVYERTRIIASIKENPKLRAAAEEMKKQGIRISDGVSEALHLVEESEFMRQLVKTSSAISSGVSTATAPVRNTAAYKALSESVSEAFDESSRYGGYEEKETRRKRREERMRKAGLSGKRKRVELNPDAGEALILSAEQEPEDTWRTRLQQNETYQRIQENYYESENPFVSGLRSVTSTVGGWFEENETARVIKMMRALDPDFQMEAFQRELREYIVPEVVDAYLNADKESLKLWCGEATYNVLWATVEQYLKQGLVSDSRVLDIRGVDISTGKILENDVPVFLVTFSTQEIPLWRSKKDGTPKVGKPDGVQSVNYAAVLTLEEGGLDDPETGGWKVMEMARRGM